MHEMECDRPGEPAFESGGVRDNALDADADLRGHLKGELEPGERLLWAARSAPTPKKLGPAYFWWAAIDLILVVAQRFVVSASEPYSPALVRRRQPGPRRADAFWRCLFHRRDHAGGRARPGSSPPS